MVNTIFIQIASYRDPELLPTIRDCIANAKNPDELRFCIAWQHCDKDEWDQLDEYKSDSRFNIIDIDYKDSKGACWARNQIQQQYNGESYTLQLDSHHRFAKRWDEKLIKMLTSLQEKGIKKPLLTSYAPSYDPENDPQGRVVVPWKMNFDRFIPEGAIFFLPAGMDEYQSLQSPQPGRFYSAHFAFTLGQFAEEVQHDPEYYFHGEEISIAVRAYTHGYDIYHPHRAIVWHEYTRKNRVKQWDDDKIWGTRNTKSHLRNRKLFEMDGLKRDIDFGKYGFGEDRSLEDYERYAGVSFKHRAIQKHTLDNKYAPNPELFGKELDDSFLRIFKHCIDINKSSVLEKDYDFWAVIFEDKEQKPVHRKDMEGPEINRLLRGQDPFIKIWREFNVDASPAKWIVWPHSKEKGWCEKIEGQLVQNGL